MRLLISPLAPLGHLPGDFHHTQPGEALFAPLPLAGKRIWVQAKRAFIGLRSGQATTVGVVAEREDVHPEEMHRQALEAAHALGITDTRDLMDLVNRCETLLLVAGELEVGEQIRILQDENNSLTLTIVDPDDETDPTATDE